MIKNTFEELRLSGNLPSPSGVGMRILQLTQGEDYSAEEIGQTIMADAALTGRLLKLANAARSASVEQASTVSEATMRLGISTVRNVALGLSLLSANRSGTCRAFPYDAYWAKSLARAVAAQAISRTVRVGSPAESYICGLLSEIGCLALASVYPEKYGEILEANLTPKQIVEEERKAFEIEHGEVAACLLEEWGLPEAFGSAIQGYESEREAAKSEIDLEDVLRMASVIGDACLVTAETVADDLDRLSNGLEEIRVRMDVEDDEFNALLIAIGVEWMEWGSTLNIPAKLYIEFTSFQARIEELQGSPDLAAEQVMTDAPAPVSKPQFSTECASSSGLRILAVDDDAMSRKLLERTLAKGGHGVLPASNGQEALQVALEQCPDVVIADWAMPGMDGIELCKALRRIESGQGMYFLLLTGRGEEDQVVEAFDAGVDDYVTKPFNPKLLMARIKGGQRIIELQAKVESDKKTMRRQVAELGTLTRKLRTAALTDALTDLPNRRYAMKRMEKEWESSNRAGSCFSIIMIDIDHFKSVNDNHGHDVGDVVLKSTSAVLKKQTRASEEPARLGGEEFLIICPNTDEETCARVAERLRISIEQNQIKFADFDRNVTISLGVAGRKESTASIDELLKAADEAVYVAKETGRNRVVTFDETMREKKTA